jgi:hypothetical protein
MAAQLVASRAVLSSTGLVKYRSDHCKKSVINMGIKIFNGLFLELKSIENFKVFKKMLKNHLICNEFYSLHEFHNQCD